MYMTRTISNTDSLDMEIRRLEEKAGKLEEKLDHNLEYLQDNYSSMIMGSLFKQDGMKSSFAGSLAGFFFGNEKLQDALSHIANTLAERATDGLEKLSEIFSKK